MSQRNVLEFGIFVVQAFHNNMHICNAVVWFYQDQTHKFRDQTGSRMYKIEPYFWYERQQRLLVLFVPKINLGLLSALTIFRSKFDLSNMRGAGEHRIHISF